MQLARFLNSTFKNDGFILIDADLKKYIIGSPKKKIPIILKILPAKFDAWFFPKILKITKKIKIMIN